MRDIEKILQRANTKNVSVPAGVEYKIRNTLYNLDKGKKKQNSIRYRNNILSKVAVFFVSIIMIGSVAYATVTAYEKIWKEPEQHSISVEVTQEEKAECISEEEAEKIGNSYLKKIGFTNESIENLKLIKEYSSQENVWNMTSPKVRIVIDGKTGIVKFVSIPTWKHTIPANYGISREDARIVARELLEKYRPENDKGEYELISLKRNTEKDEDAYIWYAEFHKKYNNLTNPAESIYIGWIPTINGLYCLDINSNAYENNEEIISKEEAIKIAVEKDSQIEKKKEIKDVEAQIRIKQMNANVFLRENFKDEYEMGTLNFEKIGENKYEIKEDVVFYKTEERVRKVWCVVIHYNTNQSPAWREFTYYVDSTTGEIIGGQLGDTFEDENALASDPNNVV